MIIAVVLAPVSLFAMLLLMAGYERRALGPGDEPGQQAAGRSDLDGASATPIPEPREGRLPPPKAVDPAPEPRPWRFPGPSDSFGMSSSRP